MPRKIARAIGFTFLTLFLIALGLGVVFAIGYLVAQGFMFLGLSYGIAVVATIVTVISLFLFLMYLIIELG